jgi:hypothetical protein
MSEAKNTKHDPRVGLSVIAMDDPYKETQLRGRVVEHRSDSDFAVIDRLSASIQASRSRSGTIPPNAWYWLLLSSVRATSPCRSSIPLPR